MARIIPSEVDPKEFHASYGEKKVYEALKSLPDEYIVFYSSHWNKRNKKNLIYVSFSQGKKQKGWWTDWRKTGGEGGGIKVIK